jgi:predicted acylesterase/phospholipase RssA
MFSRLNPKLPWLRVFACIACLAVLNGCVTSRAFVFARVEPNLAPDCKAPVRQRDVLVTVAMSGGGSRAALFGAAGLEALAQLSTGNGRSVLDQVGYVSAVSGGSIAASYYVLNKPPKEVSMLTAEGNLTGAYRVFFDQYRDALSQSFGNELFWRQLATFRWINPSLAAISLTEVLHRNLLGRATLGDANRREENGDSPGLIINATVYNSGRRLAITTQSSEEFHYNYAGDLQRSLERYGKEATIAPALKERWEQLWPITLADLDVNPCSIDMAGAVTASASFPPAIGPITFQVAGSESYWHIGDGGLYENQGVEPLLFMTLRQLQQHKIRKGLIVAFDSSFPFYVGERRLSRRAEPFSLFNFEFDRIPSIMEERATTYRSLFLRSLQLEGVFPEDAVVQVLTLRHIDAKWNADMADLPPECAGEADALLTPAAVNERISNIPTRLRVESLCDRQLLSAAAFKLVAQYRQQILDFVGAEPTVAPQP